MCLAIVTIADKFIVIHFKDLGAKNVRHRNRATRHHETDY